MPRAPATRLKNSFQPESWNSALKAGFDPGIGQQGELVNLGTHECSREVYGHQNGNDFRDESERQLLYLGQRLQKGNSGSDNHSNGDSGSGSDNYRPNCGLQNFQCVRLVHDQLIVTPADKKI